MPLASGFRLGPYRILVPIGAGKMGEVYRALDMRLERDVAIIDPPGGAFRRQRAAEVLRKGSSIGLFAARSFDRRDL